MELLLLVLEVKQLKHRFVSKDRGLKFTFLPSAFILIFCSVVCLDTDDHN